MSIRKVTKQGQGPKWEVYIATQGRGSKRLRRRFETKAEAEAFYEEYRARRRQARRLGGHTRDFEETTFREEAQYWIERQGLRFSPGHKRRCEGVLNEIFPEFGNLTPDRLDPERLSRFQSEQLAQGLTPATVNRKTDVITATLNFSVRHRRLPYNPAAGFRKLPEVREDMKFWERAEAEAFLDAMDRKYPPESGERWIYGVYLLALNTAARAGEIWGLQPQDLVQEGELIYIRRQWDLNIQGFRLPKGKKARHVPCNATLREELLRLIESKTFAPDQTLFQSQAGTPVSRDNFDKRVFRPDVKAAGVKPIRFHDLRHTATTLMIAEGLDLKTVKEICGHKEIATTMRYAHLLGDSIRQAARVFAVKPAVRTSEPTPPPRQPLRLMLVKSG